MDWTEEEIAQILKLAGIGKLDGSLTARQRIEYVDSDGTVHPILDRATDDPAEIARMAELAGIDVPKPALAGTVRTGAELAAREESEAIEREQAVAELVADMKARGADVADIFDAVVDMLVRDWNLSRETAEDRALDMLDDLIAESWDPRAAPYGGTREWKPARMGIERQSTRHTDQRYTRYADNPMRPVPAASAIEGDCKDVGDDGE